MIDAVAAGARRLALEAAQLRNQFRMIEQFADEALLVGNLPPIWMPYWSEPDKRDTERMEKGRNGLRSRDLPYIEKLLAEVPAGGYICVISRSPT